MDGLRSGINEGTNEDDNGFELHPQRHNNLSSALPSEWLHRYNQILDRYPLRTKMCTSFLVSGFGSALGSYSSAALDAKHRNELSKRGKNGHICKSKNESAPSIINWIDVLSYAIHGALVNTPICHFWYEWLSVHGPKSNTASVLVDQLVVQPPLLALMFVSLDVLRASIRAALHQFRDGDVISKSAMNALQVLPNSWRFWPFAVFFTFKFLKKKHYTVALNLCSVAWTVYLSRGGAGRNENKD